MARKKIEVEGGELALKNSFGDFVIIPKKYRGYVLRSMDLGCNKCIDEVAKTLPTGVRKAEDGVVEPGSTGDDRPFIENLPEVTITGDVLTVGESYRGEFYTENPWQDYLQRGYRSKYSEKAIQGMTEGESRVIMERDGPVIQQQYLKDANNFAAKKLMEDFNILDGSVEDRLGAYHSLSDKDIEIIRNSMYATVFNNQEKKLGARNTLSKLGTTEGREELMRDRGVAGTIADLTQGLGTPFSRTPVGAEIENQLNPVTLIGGAVSSLGQIPQNLKEGDFKSAGINAILPIAIGATVASRAPLSRKVAELLLPLGGLEVGGLKGGKSTISPAATTLIELEKQLQAEEDQ